MSHARGANDRDALRVVVADPGVAGGYAARLLIDAGAAVTVAEPADGGRLRNWSTSGRPAAAGLLRRHLLAGATPAGSGALAGAVAAADVVVVDRLGPATPSAEIATALAGAGCAVVEVSPFGDYRPAGPRPANEFSLQAPTGSIGHRGTPGQRPVPAGGRLGEWITGVFTAVAVLAAAQQRHATGRATRAAVSLFESMVCVYDSFEWLRTGFYDPPHDFGLWLDIPGVERVADGWVGITCITPAQWHAFVDMTGAEAFRGDRSIELMMKRIALRRQVDEACGPWLRAHTAAEVLAEATARGIPCSPLGNGQNLPGFDHLRERGFYRRDDDGLLHPRSPILLDGHRLDGGPDAPLAAWAGLDVPGRAAAGAPGPDATPGRDAGAGPAPLAPLAGLRVLDLGAFWAGPGCGVVLGDLGAEVVKVEGVTRPDGMRLVAPRGRGIADWWEYSGIYHGANAGKQAVSVDLSRPEGRELMLHLVERADVVVENWPAGVLERLRLGYPVLRERNPGVVLVRMPAFGLSGPWRNRRGYATTMDHISGISWVTGEPDGTPIGAKSYGDFNGSVHAAFAVLAALGRRRVTGAGGQLEVALAEACLAVTADQVIEYAATGELVQRTGSRRADAAPQGVCATADGRWVALSVPSDAAWAALLADVGPDLAAAGSAVPDAARFAALAQRWAAPDEPEALLAAVAALLPARQLLTRLRGLGVAAELVVSPSVVDADPDLVAAGFVVSRPHRLHGPLNHVALPFTLDGRRLAPATGAPTYGEHNARLPELSGQEPEVVERLRAAGVVSDSPAFG